MSVETNESAKKKAWYSYLSNKYLWISLFFLVWMLFLDNYSWLNHRKLNEEISELEVNKTYYQEEIARDMKQIKQLQQDHFIEKYARENYFMKRPNEDIYIIEFFSESKDSTRYIPK